MGGRFFQDFGGEYAEIPPPRRVYATLYDIERSRDERPIAILEAVDADHVDEHEQYSSREFERSDLLRTSLSVIEIDAAPFFHLSPDEYGEVLEIALESPGPLVNQYLSLFSPSVQRTLGRIGAASGAVARKIRAATRMNDVPDARPRDIG